MNDSIIRLAQRKAARKLAVALQHPAAVYVGGLSSGSQRTQISALRVAARFFGCDVATCAWTSLRFAEISALRAWLADHYAPASANRMLSAVRSVLQTAVKMDQLDHGVMVRAVDVPRVPGNRERVGRALSRDDFVQLFAYVDSGKRPEIVARDRAVLAVAYGGGLRRAEISKLRVDDFRDRSLLVNGKGKKVRVVPLPPATVRLLEAWLELRKPSTDPRLFGLAYDSVYHLMMRITKRSAVAHCTPHDFRRTYIGDLLDRGVDIKTIQDLAGHADPATTARYDRRGFQAKRAAAELLELPI